MNKETETDFHHKSQTLQQVYIKMVPKNLCGEQKSQKKSVKPFQQDYC
jgi:hypothetical protein